MSREQAEHFHHVIERTDRLLMILAHSSGLSGHSLAVVSGTRHELKELLEWLEEQAHERKDQREAQINEREMWGPAGRP